MLSAVVSQRIWTPFSTVPLSILEMSCWNLCSPEIVGMLSGKKIQIATPKMKFQGHVTPHNVP